jgi:predicted RNase H-like HicB family nuclease
MDSVAWQMPQRPTVRMGTGSNAQRIHIRDWRHDRSGVYELGMAPRERRQFVRRPARPGLGDDRCSEAACHLSERRLVTLIICTVDFSRRRRGVQNEFTAVFRKVPEGYIGFVEELPGANTQGETLEEVRANLEEAVRLVLEANRLLAEEELAGAEVIREPLRITAA